MTLTIHPSVDRGIQKGADNFAGGTFRCKCAYDPVEVRVDSQVAFNHACGCTKCWSPRARCSRSSVLFRATS